MSREVVTIAVFQEEAGWSLPASHVERIRRSVGAEDTVQQVRSMGPLLSALGETTVLIGFPLTGDQFSTLAGGARMVQLTEAIAGNAQTLLEATERGVRVATAIPFRAPQTAEHAVALTLALLRNLDDAAHAQSEHRWAAAEIARSVRVLSGLTVGIVALETTGREMARRFGAFGVKVLRTSEEAGSGGDEGLGEVLELEDAPQVASRADVLIVAAPRTPRTMRLIDGSALRRMKDRAVLVDVSSGGVVEHEALLEALRKHRIGGAALDGFRTRPLPPSSPLWTMPHVLITPGIAAASDRYWHAATETIAENLGRYKRGEPPLEPLTRSWFRARSPAGA